MTLPNEEILDLLADRFVVGARNIERDTHVGLSHGYKPTQTAVGTTNGAGGRNVQLLVLDVDSTVIHALPGFWHAEDLLAELRLALELHNLHRDESMAAERKLAMYRVLHDSFVKRLSPEAIARSTWQGFDVHAEVSRASTGPRDTMVCDDKGAPRMGVMKPTIQLVHERMLARPFRKLADFDLEAFVDYGRAYYDNNAGLDKGRNFARAAQANAKREREKAKAAKAAARTGG